MHAAGLLHRDIKAHNVTRADDGRVVLMDFGAGREIDDDSSSDLTGTSLYLAPEELRGEAATVRSDLYSLGVLLYRLLTGKDPVEGRTIRDLRAAHGRGERTTLETARPDLPAALVRVIDRATDLDPQARYGSAQTLAADLKAVAGNSRARFLTYAGLAAAVLVVAAGVALGPSGSTPLEPAATSPRLAVFPFENLSIQPGSDAFALGLTYEIQRRLTSVHGIELLSFASSSAFPAKGRNLRQIANDLRANFIVEGSIFRADDVLRINARLVRVADDVTIWTESFDRKSSDVFAVQDDISQAIVTSLRLKAEWQQKQVTSPELYDLFLRARAMELPRDGSSARTAVALYEQLLARDPAFAPAWAGLAGALSNVSRRARELPVAAGRIETAALKAIELDENLAEAQVAMAHVFAQDRRWKLAEAAFLRAIELNPSASHTYVRYVDTLLALQGRLTKR